MFLAIENILAAGIKYFKRTKTVGTTLSSNLLYTDIELESSAHDYYLHFCQLPNLTALDTHVVHFYLRHLVIHMLRTMYGQI